MGAVYLARDQRLGNTVALKETFFTDARMRKAFEREARLLAHLRHPALPKVIDHFDEGDGQFLVMEFIPGEDLELLLAQRGTPFPTTQVMEWADALLKALDYLHSQEPPILHRDIKPSNLKLASHGEIILLDFGLAKGSVGQMSSVATSRSVLGFTPNFAPLEQIQGTGTGPHSDIYSLAATVYYLATGTIPPDALSRAATVLSKQPDPLRRADEVNPQVPSRIAGVLESAMALNPDERPQDASRMRKALQDAKFGRSAEKTLVLPADGNGGPDTSPQRKADTDPSPTAASPTVHSSPLDPQNQEHHARALVSEASTKRNFVPWVIASVLVVLVLGAGIAYYFYGGTTATLDKSSAAPVTVSQAGDAEFKTITEAIKAAKPGAQIKVRPGVYRESLVLDRRVEITGDGPADQIVIEGVGAPALNMQTEYALVRGLTLRNRNNDSKASNVQSPGWRYTQASYAPVEPLDRAQEPNDPYKSTPQEQQQSSRPPPVNRKGARVSESPQGTSSNNANSSSPRPARPRPTPFAVNKNTGASSRTSNNPSTTNNNPSESKAAAPLDLQGAPAVLIRQGQLILEDCDITSDANVVVMVQGASSNPIVRRSKIHDNRGVGVSIFGKAQATLENCNIYGNALAGVAISEGNATIRDSTISRNGYAIRIGAGGAGEISNNDLKGNTSGSFYVETGGSVNKSGNQEDT